MKRKSQILVRVTPDEKAIIQASASSMGTNVSQLLRLLGLKANGIEQFTILIRQLTARLLRIKSLSQQRQVAPDELQSAIEGTLEALRTVEAALQPPPHPEQME
jgi:hypothetical protein